MAALAGRDVRIKYDSGGGAAVIAGARTDNMTINKGMIDITDKDDSGVRTLLDAVGTFSVTMSCSGVLKGDTLFALARSAADDVQLLDLEIEFVGIGSMDGAFFMSSFESAGEDGENTATFTANFESSGAVSWTAA